MSSNNNNKKNSNINNDYWNDEVCDFCKGIFNKTISELGSHENKVSTSEFMDNLKVQKDEIIRFLSFNCYSENESDNDIDTIKSDIFLLYSKEIAETISKIEVYAHDLFPELVEALYELLQDIVASESLLESNEKKYAYLNTRKYAYFINHLSKIILCREYLDRIKEYQNQLKNFKTHGVNVKIYGEQKKFYVYSKKEYKRLFKEYKEKNKRVHSYIISDKSNNSIRIQYHKVDKDIGLNDYAKELENLIEVYESAYPRIIEQGYKKPKWFRVLNVAIVVVTTLITFINSLKIFGIIDILDIIKKWLSLGAN